MQYDFPKMRGGQSPFGTFLKMHPFWWSFVIQNEEQANQQDRFGRDTKIIHYTTVRLIKKVQGYLQQVEKV